MYEKRLLCETISSSTPVCTYFWCNNEDVCRWKKCFFFSVIQGRNEDIEKWVATLGSSSLSPGELGSDRWTKWDMKLRHKNEISSPRSMLRGVTRTHLPGQDTKKIVINKDGCTGLFSDFVFVSLCVCVCVCVCARARVRNWLVVCTITTKACDRQILF